MKIKVPDIAFSQNLDAVRFWHVMVTPRQEVSCCSWTFTHFEIDSAYLFQKHTHLKSTDPISPDINPQVKDKVPTE